MRKFSQLALIAILVVFAQRRSAAQVSTWSAPISGEYSASANWSNGIVPLGITRGALIDAIGGSYSINIQTGNSSEVIGSIQLNSAGAVLRSQTGLDIRESVQVDAGRLIGLFGLGSPTIRVAPAATLELMGGFSTGTLTGRIDSIDNSTFTIGSMYLDNGIVQHGGRTLMILNGSQLTGVGTIIAGVGTQSLNVRASTSTGSFTLNPGVTLQTASTGGLGVSSLINRGLILIEPPAGGVMNFAMINEVEGEMRFRNRGGNYGVMPGAQTAVNRGLIDIENGGMHFPSTLENSGTIRLVNSNLSFGRPFINTGTIQLSNGTVDLGFGAGTFTFSHINSLQLSNATLAVNATLDFQGATYNVDTGMPIIGGGHYRNGTIVSTTDSRFAFRGGGTLTGMTLNLPFNKIRTSSEGTSINVFNGLTLNQSSQLDGYSLMFRNTSSLAGNATLSMSTPLSSGVPELGFYVEPAETLTIEPGITLRAQGNGVRFNAYDSASGANHVSVINKGHLIAEAGRRLVILANNFNNQGSITVENDGSLVLGGSVKFSTLGAINNNGGRIFYAGILNNTGGTLNLANTPVGPMDLSDAYIQNGYVSSPGRDVLVARLVQNRDLALENITLGANLNGRVNYYGSITLDSATIRGDLRSDSSGMSVLGNGTIVLTGEVFQVPELLTRNIAPGIVVRNELITGGVRSVSSSATLTNNGMIISSVVGKTIGFGDTNGGTVVNNGTLRANAGSLSVSSRLLNNGTVHAAAGGAIYLSRPGTNHNLIDIAPGASLTLDTTAGSGTIISHGVLESWRPYFFGNELTLSNTVDFASTSEIRLKLSTPVAGTGHDRFNFGQPVDFEGKLTVSALNSIPVPGEQFDVLTFPSYTGDLDVFNDTTLAGLRLVKMFSPTKLTLRVELLGGDANIDGTTNINDFATLASLFNATGTNWLTADFNTDGRTDISDFAILAANFNQSVPSMRQSIPEPAAGTAAVALALALSRLRHLGRRRASTWEQ